MKRITLEIFIAQTSGIIKSSLHFYKEFYFEGDEKICSEKLNNSIPNLGLLIEKIENDFYTSELKMISVFDDHFPKINFDNVNQSDRPYLFFYKGDIQLLSNIKKNVAVIGLLTPNANIEKRERSFVKKLSENNINIVSGLAKGCDSIAHDECLNTFGKTIAILPSTIRNISPAENRKLAEKIVNNGGLILTEYFNEPKNKFEAVKRYTDRDRLQAMLSDSIILTASYRQNEGDSGSRHAFNKAYSYLKKRYVMFNKDTDSNNSMFGLNYDYIINEKDVEILTNQRLGEIILNSNNLDWEEKYSPMIGDKLVFDLEGTLFFTDEINTKSYNLALENNGQKPIYGIKRITRESISKVYSQIDKVLIDKIIHDKQKIFLSLLNQIIPNKTLINTLKACDVEDAVIYTSTEKEKAEAILNYFNLEKHYKALVKKTSDIGKDVITISNNLKCNKNQLVFFEDDFNIVKHLKSINIRVITNN